MKKQIQKKPNKELVWVKIFSTNHQVYANIVRGVLEGRKIPCFMFNESLDWYPPNPWASTEFELSVPSEYFQEAFCLVAELREKLGCEVSHSGAKKEDLLNETRSNSQKR